MDSKEVPINLYAIQHKNYQIVDSQGEVNAI